MNEPAMNSDDSNDAAAGYEQVGEVSGLTFDPDITPARYIPCMMQAYPPNSLDVMFDGPVAKVGDAVEMVCYEATETTLCFKWRVVERNERRRTG